MLVFSIVGVIFDGSSLFGPPVMESMVPNTKNKNHSSIAISPESSNGTPSIWDKSSPKIH